MSLLRGLVQQEHRLFKILRYTKTEKAAHPQRKLRFCPICFCRFF